MVQTSSYKRSKFFRSNIQHCDYNYCITYLKVIKRVGFKCYHTTHMHTRNHFAIYRCIKSHRAPCIYMLYLTKGEKSWVLEAYLPHPCIQSSSSDIYGRPLVCQALCQVLGIQRQRRQALSPLQAFEFMDECFVCNQFSSSTLLLNHLLSLIPS